MLLAGGTLLYVLIYDQCMHAASDGKQLWNLYTYMQTLAIVSCFAALVCTSLILTVVLLARNIGAVIVAVVMYRKRRPQLLAKVDDMIEPPL